MLDWERDVLPVLRWTYDAMDEHGTTMLDGDELAPLITETRTKSELYEVFRLIKHGGYAQVDFAGGMSVGFVQPTEKGLQTTRGWPVPGEAQVDLLLRLLDARIASPDTSEGERTALQRLRSAAGDISQSVMTSLLSAWLSQASGIGGGQ